MSNEVNEEFKEYALSGKSLFSLKLVKDRVNFKYSDQVQVNNPDTIGKFLIDFFAGSAREKFVVVFLDAGNRITGIHIASEGGLTSAIVEPRAVFGPAILANAKAVIVAHNHPSGNPEPSRQDIRITRKLKNAGEIMDIPVFDHLVITDETYTSIEKRL